MTEISATENRESTVPVTFPPNGSAARHRIHREHVRRALARIARVPGLRRTTPERLRGIGDARTDDDADLFCRLRLLTQGAASAKRWRTGPLRAPWLAADELTATDVRRGRTDGGPLVSHRRLGHVVAAETTMSSTSAADERKPTAAASATMRCVLLTVPSPEFALPPTACDFPLEERVKRPICLPSDTASGTSVRGCPWLRCPPAYAMAPDHATAFDRARGRSRTRARSQHGPVEIPSDRRASRAGRGRGSARRRRWSSLRHSAADALYHKTGDIGKAQQLLRHESPATTAG